MTKPLFAYDCEVYINLFTVVFMNIETGEYSYWVKFNDVDSPWPLVLPEGTLIGFNSIGYDLPVLDAAIKGTSNAVIKEISDEIIVQRKQWWQFGDLIDFDQIDIINVLPGKASLKIYAGRAGYRKLQDLPIEPAAIIQPAQVNEIVKYNINDVMATAHLYEEVKPQIELRKTMGATYGIDFRSKGDAQIAQLALVSEYENKTGCRLSKGSPNALVGRSYLYASPAYMQFKTTHLQELLQEIVETDFVVNDKGSIAMPKNLSNKVIDIEGTKYKLGLGGVHSSDKAGSFYSSDEMVLTDIDITSYYPSMMIENEFVPPQMADCFVEIFKHFYDTRLAAKKSGDKVTADSLKIVLNSSFGVTGSKYSKLYAPQVMIQITLTGQLTMLMLCEQLGSRVISANTDGLVLFYPKHEHEFVKQSVEWFENVTRLNMEWTPFKSYHRKDVNNFISVTDTGIKTKGCFTSTSLSKNPANEVIYKAVIAKFVDGADIETFIRNHKVVMDFTSLRTVRGGCISAGVPYGKSIRWYWSTTSKIAMYYQVSGNLVPGTECSNMMMDLTDELPDDIDYNRYISEATKLYEKIK